MIEVSEKPRIKICNSCYSDKNVTEFTIKKNSSEICIALCSDCMEEFRNILSSTLADLEEDNEW